MWVLHWRGFMRNTSPQIFAFLYYLHTEAQPCLHFSSDYVNHQTSKIFVGKEMKFNLGKVKTTNNELRSQFQFWSGFQFFCFVFYPPFSVLGLSFSAKLHDHLLFCIFFYLSGLNCVHIMLLVFTSLS